MARGRRRVLIAVTSHLGPLGRRPTGAWLGEISGFWHEMVEAGLEVEYASPRGGDPPIDPVSALLPGESKDAFVRSGERERLMDSMRSVDVEPARYDAIFFAGGHGALWDFPSDPGLVLATEAIWRDGGVVAAVCHGPAALLEPKDAQGRSLLEGRRATCYSNFEETLGGVAGKVPFLLETSMKERGARFEKAMLPFTQHVVIDGRLVTGQNPASARGVGRAVAELLGATPRVKRVERQPSSIERR
ncbi:type 1 glutamine amidotransferase domain-containing protein [Sandaracinus amylolyticus]|uniref:type 1 glutamine amidotransferase domain-containing protein n=1 Tax=Sandaracinus amylolyticus TaxID=927083 RepID=UPI001F3A31AB|nr:type 1 glutamine amidotransferase domain-containing protein [Sandaracinus amylolyticus]UJR81186.1 Thiazole biosynthesis protein ThiJ [Sandaracinus amylolyticus]